jgi:hypothetical protein
MQGIPTFIDDRLQRLFLDELLSTPRGQATLLKQLAEAEGGDGGELDIFEHILEVIDDGEVKKLVRVHKEDEERHEQLFFALMRRSGGEPMSLPKSAHLLRRLDAHTGFFSRSITDRSGVVAAYMLLLVIEERATRQFGRWEAAFRRRGDHEAADTIAAIGKDEERHLKYCEAITKRYSTSEDERQARLAHYRALESKCFDEVQALNLTTLVDNGFVGHTWWTKSLFTFLAGVAKRRMPEVTSLAAAHA